MLRVSAAERRRLESLSRTELETHQLARLNTLLRRILPGNRFYAEKLASVVDPQRLADPATLVPSLEEFAEWPLTYKEELINHGSHDKATANLTFPRREYTRFHQTSGTHGRPLVVLDTAEDWQWWKECWQYVLDAAELEPGDCALMAFSFGPFIGFWSAFDAAIARGCMVIPGGGISTLARIEMLRSQPVSTVFCTPSYALHMAEVAAQHGIKLGHAAVKKFVLAGEPGGSTPATRSRIENAWHAKVLDHAGASEVGPWGVGDTTGQGMWIIESEFIAEFRSLETGQPAGEGELAELILTNLGRLGSPILRYRTGDIVRPCWNHGGDKRFVFLAGGVIGRVDDMVIVRGVNVFPSAVEQIVRSFPEIAEYRVFVRRVAEMDQLTVEIEDHLNQPQRLALELQVRLGLRAEVHCVQPLSLPRFEGKGKRFLDERTAR